MTYTELATGEFAKGRAYGVKGESNLLDNKLGLTGYYKWIDNDFSTSATSSQQGKELIGFGLTYDFNAKYQADCGPMISSNRSTTVILRHSLQVGATRTETSSVQLTHKSDRLTLTAAAPPSGGK